MAPIEPRMQPLAGMEAAATDVTEVAVVGSAKVGAADAWACWQSGEHTLNEAVRRKRWSDGAPVGKGHLRPYLQSKHARKIADGSKTIEGRPRCGWAVRAKKDDYVLFNISGSGGKRLACRVLGVRTFPTFAAMLEECGIQVCLPGFAGGIDGAVQLYQSFASSAGTYADLDSSLPCFPRRASTMRA